MEDSAAEAQSADQALKQSFDMLSQHTRHISFKNKFAKKNSLIEVASEVTVQINLDVKKRSKENQYEVVISLKAHSKSRNFSEPLYMLDLEYGGVFQVIGVTNDRLHPFLLIEGPKMLFPFMRRVVSDVTRDGGFPPLNLGNINFLQLYKEKTRRRQEVARNHKPEQDRLIQKKVTALSSRDYWTAGRGLGYMETFIKAKVRI